MDAYLRPTDRLFRPMADSVEKTTARRRSAGAFCDFNPRTAKRMGVNIGIGDLARIAATGLFIGGRLVQSPRRSATGTAEGLGRYLTRQVRHRLDVYGIPEYTTDHRHYAHRPPETPPLSVGITIMSMPGAVRWGLGQNSGRRRRRLRGRVQCPEQSPRHPSSGSPQGVEDLGETSSRSGSLRCGMNTVLSPLRLCGKRFLLHPPIGGTRR